MRREKFNLTTANEISFLLQIYCNVQNCQALYNPLFSNLNRNENHWGCQNLHLLKTICKRQVLERVNIALRAK